MEKNRFSNQNLSKGQITETKKGQVSDKWPRYSKRREQPNVSGSKPENYRNCSGKAQTVGKARNQTNYNYDKRSKQRPDGVSEGYPENENNQLEEQNTGTGLAPSVLFPVSHELHSVFSPGSKKQSLNHLLNFHYEPREHDLPTRFSKTGNNRSYVRKMIYNKEQFLQANCQFVVRAHENYVANIACPDQLVDWAKIEQIHILSYEEPQCPICLYPPVAAKMTKCGHVYCWPCILHYLALSDKAWRKCPICFDAIHLPDLRSAVSKPFHPYTVGEIATFQLMRREKASTNVALVAELKNEQPEIPYFCSKTGNTTLSKLLLAETPEILNIIAREQKELENQMVVDGVDCPENIFVEQALEQLKERKEGIMCDKVIALPVDHRNKESDTSVIDEHQTSMLLDAANITSMLDITGNHKQGDFMIDEDSNFLLSDVDIIPTATCASDYFYFYQSTDGQPLYLHSLNTRMLQTMYGSLDKSPLIITGKIVHKDSCSMSEDLRKRLKYLQHLPVCTPFEVVEIELGNGIVSSEVMAKFKDEISSRRKDRQKRARAERIRERQIFEFNERQLGKSLARSAKIPINSTKHFPSCGNAEMYDFSHDPPLGFSPSSSDMSASPSVISAEPSWSKMLCTSPPSSSWPILPSGGAVYAAPTPKLIQVTGSKMITSVSRQPSKWRFPSESDGDDNIEEHQAARDSKFGEDLSSAIGAALERATLHCEVATSEDGSSGKFKGSVPKNVGAGSGAKKKNKNKKTLLFASGMNLY
ncbi:E3 ubiquitin-protein ligase RNF10 isoform X2 [Topomyia yanbarensis]|uniref:E3 ubiquitin-protein ligase RNF10 isoform X2 n=1 Tax=Topomyia yanbarensis TaxID=2498891 RepID=UPI00273B6E93|nr:E3 ubiquitin-protein ligase RNF10 isoform X2 [Topomyia yanbarensis]